MAIWIGTARGLLRQGQMKVLEFLGKPTLSWPIGAATVAILGTAGLLAGYFPARRAAAIDPSETLRDEGDELSVIKFSVSVLITKLPLQRRRKTYNRKICEDNDEQGKHP